MAVSEKKKKSNAEWDAKNMQTIGCKLRKEQAQKFKDYAQEQGKTANTVLKEYVLECIGESGKTEQ